MRRLRWRWRENQNPELRTPNYELLHNVPDKPRPQRRFISRQRFGAVKVSAGLLFRRAAGMENRGAFRRRQTRQIQFLECRCRHGGNLRPMFDDSGRESASFADFPVGGVVFELKREELEGKLVKISEGRVTRVPIMVSEFGLPSAASGRRMGVRS